MSVIEIFNQLKKNFLFNYFYLKFDKIFEINFYSSIKSSLKKLFQLNQIKPECTFPSSTDKKVLLFAWSL